MDPEAEGQASAEIEADVSTDSTPEAGSGDAPLSFADAFAAAKAELESAPQDTSEDSRPEATQPEAPQPETSTEQQPETPKEPEKPVTPQSVLDRVLTLAREDRFAEMTPTERGIYKAIEKNVEQRQATQSEMRDKYLELLTERQVDPEAFQERIESDPGAFEFYRAYKAAHPEVTLENPNPGPRQPSPDEVRAEVRQAYNTGLQNLLQGIASDRGIDFASLPGVAEGKFGTAVTSLVEKAVEEAVAKELPKRLEKEREAIRLEVQAEYANKTIVVPRSIGGGATDPSAKPASTGNPWADAFAEAKAELERAS